MTRDSMGCLRRDRRFALGVNDDSSPEGKATRLAHSLGASHDQRHRLNNDPKFPDFFLATLLLQFEIRSESSNVARTRTKTGGTARMKIMESLN
jgi:hypothetical protein